MKPITLSKTERIVLVSLTIFGLVVPNGFFVYYFVTSPETTRAAMSNPISVVFIAEAFILMFLFAWLLKKADVKKPSAWVFVMMSLVGSMVFSVPATLYMISRNRSEVTGARS